VIVTNQAIELFFDPATEVVLTSLLRELDPSPLLQWGVRPHVSLLLCAEFEAGSEAALAAFARAQPPLPIVLASVGSFPGDLGVVFLAPIGTRALLDLHVALNDHMAAFTPRRDAHYEPGVWVPHCTQGMLFNDDQLADALEICRRAPPITGTFTEIGFHETTTDTSLSGFDRVIDTRYPATFELA